MYAYHHAQGPHRSSRAAARGAPHDPRLSGPRPFAASDRRARRECRPRRAQLHHAEQAEREHPHRHVPRLRAVHPRAVFEGDPRVLQPARRSVYRRARAERPDGRCQLRAVAAHGLCPARLHRARVRRRQLL